MVDKVEECPSCALDVEAGAEVCPYCGYEFPRQKRGLPIIAVLLAFLMAGWLLVFGC